MPGSRSSVRSQDLCPGQWITPIDYRHAENRQGGEPDQFDALEAMSRHQFYLNVYGIPFFVLCIDLPFALVQSPNGHVMTLDTRSYVLKHPDSDYVATFFGKPINDAIEMLRNARAAATKAPVALPRAQPQESDAPDDTVQSLDG